MSNRSSKSGFFLRHASSLLLAIGTFVAVMALLALVADTIVMPMVVGRGREFAIPNLCGMSLASAQKKIDQSGLILNEIVEEFDQYHPRGIVISQNPPPGSLVKSGQNVRVTVSKGIASALVPYLKGISLREAKLILENAGLTLGEVVWFSDDEFPDGVVMETNPPAGTAMKFNSPVQLVVNRRDEMAMLTMPNFLGMDLEEARRKAFESNVLIGKVSYVEDDRVLPETVLSQSIVPGTKVLRWTKVDLVVARSE